uniref:Putative transcription elongation factor mitochondrial n=1 Tax=Ixodes ricinus TaxID=34613 RepID=A0A131YA31_IXORI
MNFGGVLRCFVCGNVLKNAGPRNIFAATQSALRNISFGPQYTSEQQDQVLRILNHSSEKELQKLSIGASSILRILHHREENGGFESIDHVLSIRGFQEKGLKKICEAVLYGKKPQVKRPDRTSIVPALSQERIQEVAKVLAVDVSPPYITWAHLSRDKQILSWERTKFLEEKSRHHLHSYYSAVQEVLPSLPAADLYLVEQRPTRQKQSSESLHLRTQLAIQAMLVALLSHGKEHQPQVVSIKSAAITQLFQLNVGNERISGQETLNRLFESGALLIEKGLRTSYLQESSVNREHLCNVLLLAHAFYLLVES